MKTEQTKTTNSGSTEGVGLSHWLYFADIQKKYPKALKGLCSWYKPEIEWDGEYWDEDAESELEVSILNGKAIYKFFDEQDIYADIQACATSETILFRGNIVDATSGFPEWIESEWKRTRAEAETDFFTKAFEILESKI